MMLAGRLTGYLACLDDALGGVLILFDSAAGSIELTFPLC